MLTIQNIKVEYLREPNGIDITKPMFSYTLEGDSSFQSANRLVCAYGQAF
jgi:hypothetical protein